MRKRKRYNEEFKLQALRRADEPGVTDLLVAEELGIKPLSEESEVDILYFVGCYGSFDRRNIQVARSFVTLCQAAGIKVGILGKEEKCCGEPMRKMGNEYLFSSKSRSKAICA